jgi:hypothetical protein
MMSVIERWTIYEGIEGTHGIWTERGDHPGWKGKLRGKFRRVVVVPEDQLAGAVVSRDDLLAWLEDARLVGGDVVLHGWIECGDLPTFPERGQS